MREECSKIKHFVCEGDFQNPENKENSVCSINLRDTRLNEVFKGHPPALSFKIDKEYFENNYSDQADLFELTSDKGSTHRLVLVQVIILGNF